MDEIVFYIIYPLLGLPQPAGRQVALGCGYLSRYTACHPGITCHLSNVYLVVTVACLLLLSFLGHRKLTESHRL